jgi:hypothetical protein
MRDRDLWWWRLYLLPRPDKRRRAGSASAHTRDAALPQALSRTCVSRSRWGYAHLAEIMHGAMR